MIIHRYSITGITRPTYLTSDVQQTILTHNPTGTVHNHHSLQIELSRGMSYPTYAAHLSCISSMHDACTLLMTFTYYYVNSQLRKHMAWGSHDRQVWPTKTHHILATLMGHAKRFKSITKPVFRRYVAYESLKCLNLEMWQSACQQWTTDDVRCWQTIWIT